jgi:hypothetical protein
MLERDHLLGDDGLLETNPETKEQIADNKN